MALSFLEKRTLENGSVIFYHQGKLNTGNAFHLLTLVKGEKVQLYLNFIAKSENFKVIEIEKFAKIISCDEGNLSDAQIDRLIHKLALTA